VEAVREARKVVPAPPSPLAAATNPAPDAGPPGDFDATRVEREVAAAAV
jgi:hypothetical protein